jgi:Uma2 family endonuclease
LAVEVSGRDEGEPELRNKAAWYLEHGVKVVWLVLTDTRDILVVTSDRETRCRAGERLPAHPELPGLEPAVDRFFAHLA